MVLTQVIKFKGIHTPFRVMYLPRGPLLDWRDKNLVTEILDDLKAEAREKRAVWLKIDPEAVIGFGPGGMPAADDDRSSPWLPEMLRQSQWVYSSSQVQFKNSVWIDLRKPLDELFAALKQKTRYNIRLAEKRGVKVREGTAADFEQLYQLYAVTSQRDGFLIRPREYYLQLWENYHAAELLTPLIAEFDGQLIAGLMLFHQFQRSWYLHGMSGIAYREHMPNHLLQWEAIKRAQSLGCLRYDMWGAPDTFDDTDRMWGVYKFKEGFSGEVVRAIGAWDYAPSPTLYKLFEKALSVFRFLSRRRAGNKLPEL